MSKTASQPRAQNHKAPRDVEAILAGLRPAYRLAPDRSRRLQDLIAKSKSQRLSRREGRELRALLDEVDRRSAEMLARAADLVGRPIQTPGRAPSPTRRAAKRTSLTT
jgi:hypothetical protein